MSFTSMSFGNGNTPGISYVYDFIGEKLNPGIQLMGLETGGGTAVVREIAGSLWFLTNCDFSYPNNIAPTQFQQINFSLPSYATELSGGTLQTFTKAAGSLPWSSWGASTFNSSVINATSLSAGLALANIGIGNITSAYLAIGSALANIGTGGVTAPYLATGSVKGPYDIGAGIVSSVRSDKVTVAADCGVVGDGATDDTVAMQRAINTAAATGGSLYLGPGIYHITSTLTVPGAVSIKGAGYNICRIDMATPSATLFSCNGVQSNRFEDFGINYPTAGTSGGKAFSLTNCFYTWITRVAFGNAWNDVWASGCIGLYVELINVSRSTNPGTTNTADSIYLTNNCAEVHIRDCVLGTLSVGSPAAPRAGIHIDNAQQVLISNCDVEQWQYGLLVNPSAGNSAYNSCVLQSQFDYCSIAGMYFAAASSTAKVYMWTIQRCWTGGSQGNGLYLQSSSGGLVDSFLITSHQSINCQYNGLLLVGATHVNVQSGIFESNSVSGGIYAGINTLGCSHVLISNNLCGNNVSYPVTQRYGIAIESTSTYLTVLGNDVSNNLTSAISVISGSSTNRVKDNVGYNPVGPVAISLAASGSAITNPYGVDGVLYISGGAITGVQINGTGGSGSTNLISGAFRLPAGGSITIFYTSAPTLAFFLE